MAKNPQKEPISHLLQLLASGMLKGVAELNDKWAYRIPYALQWIWPVPLIIGIALCPESPYWLGKTSPSAKQNRQPTFNFIFLVKHDRIDDAKRSLLRLVSPKDTDFNPDEAISMIIHTNEFEKAQSAGTSYLDCFKGVNLRRTEICAITWLIQCWSGSTIMNFSTYFY